MKIALIQPPRPVYGAEAEQHWQLTRPLSLFFLAASLEKHTEHKVDIVDFEQKRYKGTSIDSILVNTQADIFGITATTYTRFEAIKIAKCIKQSKPDAIVIVGGVHFMHTADDTLRKVPEIDIVVRGEGEITIVELANALSRGTDLHGIKGITYRKDGQVVSNLPQTVFEDPDALPVYTRFSWDEYPEYLFGYPERVPAISVMASRGCPYKCIFCAKAGSTYRTRNPIAVVDEIELLRRKFDIKAINFLDLTFTANPQYVRALCEEIIRRRIDIKWWCECRANASADLLKLMKSAGCVSVAVGIESGSERILSKISKGISTELAFRFCKNCSELGIFVAPYFMFSHPGETKEDVEKTLELIAKLERFNLQGSFQPTMIFPGTELEKIARSQNIIPCDFSWSDPYESTVNMELGQLITVPLFIDKLTINEMRGFIRKLTNRRQLRQVAKTSADMTLGELIPKALKYLINREPSAQYVFSPRLYYEYIASKLRKRRASPP